MRPLPLLLLLLALPALADDPPATSPGEPTASPAPAPPPAPLVTEPIQLQPPVEPPPALAPETSPPAPEKPVTPAAAEPASTVAAAPAPRLPRFGMRLGLGLPDALTADMIYRPLPFLRLHAGPAWNYLSMGVQGGVAIQPFRWWASPVLEASYGHFFGGDLTRLVHDTSNGSKLDVKPLLRKVGYDYFSGRLSLEFGSPRGFAFSIGLGISYFWTTLHGTATGTTTSSNPAADGYQSYRLSVTNPSLRAVIPSARLGFLFYF
jgi:hypothetical protein